MNDFVVVPELPEIGEEGNVYVLPNGEEWIYHAPTFRYDDPYYFVHWTKIGELSTSEEEPPKMIPTNCKNCGAPLENGKCKYCGTEYR